MKVWKFVIKGVALRPNKNILDTFDMIILIQY